MAEAHPGLGDYNDQGDRGGETGPPFHSDVAAFECQFCTTTFTTLDAYAEHSELHLTLQGPLEHTCQVCQRQFVCRDELQLHSRLLHLNLKPYKCKLCDQSFALQLGLEYHLQLHGGQRVYRCELCTAIFSALDDLHEHLKDHQMGRLEEVPQAEQQQQEEEEDVSMMDAVYPELELTTQSRDSEDIAVGGGGGGVAKRIEGSGDEVETKAAVLTTDGLKSSAAAGAHLQFKSERVDSEPSSVFSTMMHSNGGGGAAAAATGEDDEEEAIFARAVNIKKTFCNLCNKKMATRKSLNTHYKSVHMKNAHTCSVCRTSFLFSRLLEAHTRKRKRIIPCEFCELRFCSNKRWSSHIVRHQTDSMVSAASGGGVVIYPRAVPITSSSSRPMVAIPNAVSQQAAATQLKQQQQFTAINNFNNNNNIQRQSLLKNNSVNNSGMGSDAGRINSGSVASTRGNNLQPTISLVNLTEGGNTIGKFPCDACGKIFLSLNYLQSHLLKRKNPNFQYQCDVCEHRFSKKVILEEHKAYHERNPKKVPKLVINKSRVNGMTSGGGTANSPQVSENSKSNATVAGGGKSAATSSQVPADADEEMDYERHIIRLSDTSFKCNCCHRTFKAVNHLKCHLRYTHMKKNFKCRSCSQQFQFYKLYLAHMKHSKLCERCDKRICAKFDFKIHTQKCRGTAKLRNSTGNMNIPKLLPITTIPETVEIKDDDDEDIDDDVLFNAHTDNRRASAGIPEMHHHQSLLLPSSGNNNNNQSLDDLMDTSEYPSLPHFLMDDLAEATEEYKCEPCGKAFGKLTSLHMHSFQHEPNKEMKCLFCNFLFLQRSSLNRHYRCRNTLHTCQVCKESFCSHVNLRQHACSGVAEDNFVSSAGVSGNGGSAGIMGLDQDSEFVDITMLADEKKGGSILSAELRRKSSRGVVDLGTVAMGGGIGAVTRSGMGVNSEDVSGRDESIELSDTEPDSLTCMMCMTVLNTKAELDHHVATEHGTVTKCTVCFKSFRSPTILHIHMAARASKKNKIACPSCSHRFNKQSEYRKHFLYHTMKASRPEMSDEAIYSRIASKYAGK